jgi:hypothetical protein
VINGAIYALTYDVVNDFAPIALIADSPILILAKKAMPANDLKGLIVWLKANPNVASLGQTGLGSPARLAGILFQKQTEPSPCAVLLARVLQARRLTCKTAKPGCSQPSPPAWPIGGRRHPLRTEEIDGVEISPWQNRRS